MHVIGDPMQRQEQAVAARDAALSVDILRDGLGMLGLQLLWI